MKKIQQTEEKTHKTTKKRQWKLNHAQVIVIYMMMYDFVTVAASYGLALWIRFDCQYQQIPEQYFLPYRDNIFFHGLICIFLYWFCYLYNSIWRFASYNELVRVTVAAATTAALHSIYMNVYVIRMPISYFVFGGFFQYIFALGIRFGYRFLLLVGGGKNSRGKSLTRVMVVGAGAAGQLIMRDITRTEEVKEKVCCFIDDNPNKWRRILDGIPVVGGRERILEACKNYRIDKIYVTIPSAARADKKEILNICKESGCELLDLPEMYQLYMGKISVSVMREVTMEDLLGRDPVEVNMEEIFQVIQGKTILVTGGGGSIGSELCRQIAIHDPGQLIIFDIYENNAYDVQMELKREYPDLKIAVEIGSVRDSRRLFKLFEEYKPEIVYHAAAHKHVPLMEDSPCEAIKNNTIGTYKTAYAAMVYGCRRFVLISTDKAVNPSNIMGASKRLCEMVIQAFDHKIKEGKADEIPQLFTHFTDCGAERKQAFVKAGQALKHAGTEFVAVRFGNVLGSNGSVIPLFQKQIAAGGPVTVTHPDIIRYFMTIPEAVNLVLQAGVYAQGGEIFVLDMGEPVKIDTLARNLIYLSGYQPDVDIKVTYTGLRPGEKLYEEKLMAEEGLRKTANNLINIGCPVPFDFEKFLQKLGYLMDAAYKNKDNIRELVQELVATYQVMEENMEEASNGKEAYEMNRVSFEDK